MCMHVWCVPAVVTLLIMHRYVYRYMGMHGMYVWYACTCMHSVVWVCTWVGVVGKGVPVGGTHMPTTHDP